MAKAAEEIRKYQISGRAVRAYVAQKLSDVPNPVPRGYINLIYDSTDATDDNGLEQAISTSLSLISLYRNNKDT